MDEKIHFDEIRAYYPEIELKNLMVKWSHRHLSKYYKEGYKWCVSCHFLVKIEERLCRKCRNAMRTRIRNKRGKGYQLIYTVPRDSPVIIDKENGVII